MGLRNAVISHKRKFCLQSFSRYECSVVMVVVFSVSYVQTSLCFFPFICVCACVCLSVGISTSCKPGRHILNQYNYGMSVYVRNKKVIVN